MEIYRESLDSMFSFRMRTATLVTALCVFILATGPANAVTYTDSSPQTVEGQDFIFTFSPVDPWNMGNGTFTVHARGDYTVGISGEYLDWDIDGVASGRAGPSDGGTVIQTFSYDDVEWEQSFTISGTFLNAITSDSSIVISIDLSSAVGYQIDPSKHFVRVELTYNSSAPPCPPPPEPNDPGPCDGATDVPIDTCLSWGDSGGGPAKCVVVPNENISVEGNSNNAYPFNLVSSMRYQQIYDAAEVGQSGVITEIRFRPDAAAGVAFSSASMDVEIFLGYAATSVLAPSETFADNIGPGYVKVYDGIMTLSSDAVGGPPRNFDIILNVDDIFEYNPANGLLLLDIKLYSSSWSTQFDAAGYRAQTATTRIRTNASGSVNDPTGVIHLGGSGSDPYGLVTMFCFNGATPLMESWDNVTSVPVIDPNTCEVDPETGIMVNSAAEDTQTTNIDIDSSSEPESPKPISTTEMSGFIIRDGIWVQEQNQDEISTEVVEDIVSFTSIVGATLINFDDGSAPCGFLDTVRLTDKYAALGVIFEGPGGNDGGAILDECGNFYVSGYSRPNFLAFNSGARLGDGGIPCDPETIHFNPAVSQVQVLAGSWSNAGQMLTIEAYNNSNVLVDSATITLSATLTPISVSGDGITRVVISTSASVFVLDDLQFVTGEVCPTTWDVYLGTDPCTMALVCTDLNEPNCCPGVLDPGTMYFWQVIAKNPSDETPGDVWSFETEGGEPPDCNSAVPSVAEIWPPRHDWVDIEILDVNDPDGDPVTITITGITQDEPVAGYGSGRTSPDGMGVGTSVAHVRAERSGKKSNGRVYEISFEADDGTGNTCNGSVKVCVPHDQGRGHECVDDGQLYDSTAAEMFIADLNRDGVINLLDFQILTKYWLVSYELED